MVVGGFCARSREEFLIDVRPQVFKAWPRRVWKHRNRAVPVARELFSDEILNLRPLTVAEEVDLHQQKRNVWSIAAELPNQFDVMLGKRRVYAHSDQRQAHIAQPIERSLCTVFQDALQSRRIYGTEFHGKAPWNAFPGAPAELV